MQVNKVPVDFSRNVFIYLYQLDSIKQKYYIIYEFSLEIALQYLFDINI